jgi:hypothetical protein
MSHAVLAEHGVGAVHVAHHDGHVLEPAVIAPGVAGNRPASWRDVLGELDLLVAQPHPDHARP